MNRLEHIIAATRERVAVSKQTADVNRLRHEAEAWIPRGFRRRLAANSQASPAVIAELKKASPSRGVIRGSFPVAALASQLARSGATALSVLTDEQFFQGSLANLLEASAATDVPCLRKDFIVDEFQVLEARAHHADAILLILAALNGEEFARLLKSAQDMGLDAVCEVHDDTELQRALDAGAGIIGVNSRDLKTFEVRLATLWELASSIPSGALRIAESGIAQGMEIRELYDAGYQAFLVGETLMRAEDPGKKLKLLLEEAGFYPPSANAPTVWRGQVH